MSTTPPNNWENYHRNIALHVDKIINYQADGPMRVGESVEKLQRVIGHAIDQGAGMGVIGSGWSLSRLVGMERLQLLTDQLNAMTPLRARDLDEASELDHRDCLFVGGGTKAFDLASFAEAWLDRSIWTCGSYLGPSVAGSLATSVNGSRLGYGGFQNQVRGINFIAGKDRSVWVEPQSSPVLADEAIDQFANHVIRDDAVFAGCLVHLGGMGIVNSVVLELAPKHNFAVLRKAHPICEAWMQAVREGNFRAIARMLGYDEEPAYYEVQVDPFNLFVSPALHTLFFRTKTPAPAAASIALLRPFDGIRQYAAAFGKERIDGTAVPDLFAYYAAQYFKETVGPAPIGAAPWGALHAAPPHEELRGVVYTSAFAVERTTIDQVLGRCSEAVSESAKGKEHHLLYTLRFVSSAKGAMAFTRFDESVVIDMEGLAPSIYNSKEQALATVSALQQEPTINYCQHWAKLQAPDAAQVEREFGPSSDPDSLVSLWRKARNRIVSCEAQAVLWNHALCDWGLITEL